MYATSVTERGSVTRSALARAMRSDFTTPIMRSIGANLRVLHNFPCLNN